MRGAWLLLALVSASTAGCFDFLEDESGEERVRPADVEDDPASYSVSGVRVWPEPPREGVNVPSGIMVASQDGTQLSVKVYEPLVLEARDDLSPIRLPVVYLFHPWGFAKEYFENAPLGDPSQENPDPRVNLMQRFSEAGFITVAYDIRGFGQSEGSVMVAGAADLQDFLAVHNYVEQNFDTSGRVGVAGPSLGGGMAMRMLADSGVVDAAANLYGWVDLYDGLLPGDVPKAEWGVLLVGTGQAGSHGRLHSDINDWLANAMQRTQLDSVEESMDARSTVDKLPDSDVPLFLCQGLQESLFPQAHRAWEAHGGFVRSYIYTGGHVSQEVACWDRTLQWMDYFLRGVDTQVDQWPFVDTVDADPQVHRLSYSQEGLANTRSWLRYLHEPNLVEGPSQRTFSVDNYVLSNPFHEPAVVGDVIGNNAIPEQLRDDSGGVFFAGGALDETQVVLGTPTVHLVPTNETRAQQFQVTVGLYMVDAGGRSQLITRGAYAHVVDEGEAPAAFDVPMEWTKATVEAGSRLVLKVAANDLSWYMPMPPNQQPPGAPGARTFTGESQVEIPLFQG